MSTIAVIGGGKIGEALISGLVAAGHDSITVTNRSVARGEELAQRYGVKATTNNAEAARGADVVFVCVKPYAVVDVVEDIAAHVGEASVVVSMAAGVTLASLENAAPGRAVVRVMPNTPMLLGRGMSIVCAGTAVDSSQLELVVELMHTVGKTVVLDEKLMDVGTALSGSSPAYFYLIAESLIDAGVSQGVPRDVAAKLVNESILGAGEMLVDAAEGVAGGAAARLRYDVTSPGGTTAAAIRALEDAGIRGAMFDAVEACARRSRELG